MPATLLDSASSDLAPPSLIVPAAPEGRPVPRLVRQRRAPSRRRRRVTGRLSRLAALLAMGAWVAVGLMPVAAVLLSVYG